MFRIIKDTKPTKIALMSRPILLKNMPNVNKPFLLFFVSVFIYFTKKSNFLIIINRVICFHFSIVNN